MLGSELRLLETDRERLRLVIEKLVGLDFCIVERWRSFLERLLIIIPRPSRGKRKLKMIKKMALLFIRNYL